MTPEDYEQRIRRGESLGQIFLDRDENDRANVLDAFVVWLECTPLLDTLEKMDEIVDVLARDFPEYQADQSFLDAIECECTRRYARDNFDFHQLLESDSYGPVLPDGDGRYMLINLLGKGAQGVVYKAVDRKFAGSSDGVVAIKVYDRIDLVQEVRAKRVEHPNVVRVLEQGHDLHGCPTAYVVYAYLGGLDIKEYVRGRSLGVNDVIRMMIQLCDGVVAIHNASIVHRDIKPANIIMDGDRPVIADFGIASDGLRDRAPAGSPAFMAPEQVDGVGESALVDIYGLGGVAYFLMTGRAPNEHGQPMPVGGCGAVKHRRLRRVIAKCLEHDPKARYLSAESLASDLQAIKDHRAISACRSGSVETVALVIRRRPIWGTIISLACAVFIAMVVMQAGLANEIRTLKSRDKNSQLIFEHLVFEMRLRSEIDPSAFWALTKLSDRSEWAHKLLVATDGMEMLRAEVLSRSASGGESDVMLGFWWMLLAKVQVSAQLDPDLIADSFAAARMYFIRGLREGDQIILGLDAEETAWRNDQD